MSFKVGDRVQCINWSGWQDVETGLDSDGPKYLEKLTVDALDFQGWPMFNKYIAGEGYYPPSFQKLDDDFGAKVCEEIEKTFIKPLMPVEHES